MRRLGAAVVAALLMAGCAGDANPSIPESTTPDREASAASATAATEPATTSSTLGAAAAGYLEGFEFAWTTIDQRFYDRDMGGVDWDEVHERYRPQVAAAQTDLEAFYLVNAMLWELGVSHVGITPPDDPGQLNPVLTSGGELGIDVRLLDGEWVITEVNPGSAAADAGLRVGYLLESIGGQTVDQVAGSAVPMPPRHERGVRSGQIMGVQAALYGDPGVTVSVGYRDDADRPLQAELTFRQRVAHAWSPEMLPGAPPAYTTIEVDRLDGDIGYLRFDAFGRGMLAPLLEAIDTLQDAPGLIIDLRGNEGGVFDVRKPLIDRLVAEPALIWSYRWRYSQEDIFATPAELTYDGPLVVLVDVLSESSAEEFAGALQTMGRAYVIGERTAGRVLVADVATAPNGALLIFPVGQSVLGDGTVLEGHGVIPDLAVSVGRSDLLAGTDPPLQAAIDHIRSLPG